MGIKQDFRDFLLKIYGGERKYNYRIAVSSGKAVSQDIPVLLGKRVGWATRQGANFVEIAFAAPSEVLMGKEELINNARQLGLDYSFHPSESLGLDSTYMEQGRGGLGFNPAHRYLKNSIIVIGNFKQEMEKKTPRKVYSFNIHAANNPTPPVDERLASDVSADPFGQDIRNISDTSKIWGDKNFRERFWKDYLKEKVVPIKDLIPTLLQLFLPDLFEKKLSPVLEGILLERGQQEIEEQIKLNPEYAEREGEFKKNLAKRVKKMSFRERLDAVGNEIKEVLISQISQEEDVKNAIADKFKKDTRIINYLIHSIRLPFLSEDDIMKESFLYRELMPRWMPHSKHQQVRELWQTITGLKRDSVKGAEKELRKLLLEEVRGEEKMIAAVAACYIWGHLTQVEDFVAGANGFEKKFRKKKATLTELIEYYDLQINFEAHMSGGVGSSLRLYLPEDILALIKAINSTKIGGKKYDIARMTIDMEHISTSGINPLIALDPEFAAIYDGKKKDAYKRLGLKGIKNEDGKYIRTMHVTHPYITEGGAGHQHGPIRRGDTTNFNYIYALTRKEFAQDEKNPAIIMYEIGTEKAESVYMLRLIMEMIEAGIKPDDLKIKRLGNLEEKPKSLKERLIREFFDLGEAELLLEKQMILEHALDPIQNLLWASKPSHTWTSRAAIQRGSQPEEVQREQYQ